ncbi:unnamed protein product [Absidia cylindrospora]
MAFKDEVIVSSSTSSFIQWFGFDQFQPERAVTSHFVSTKTFLCIRLILVLYSGAVQWASVWWMATHYQFSHYFAYFTYLTFIGLHAYFLTSFYHHIRYISSSKRPTSFLYQSAIWNHLYVYLYHTNITFNLVTPIVYWVLLSSDFVAKAETNPPMEWWLTPSVHGASLVMMMVDVILNRMIIHKRMCLLVLLTIVFYIGLAFIYYASEHWWVYSFMDWSYPGTAAMYYVALGVFITLCFFLQVGLHALRDKMAPKQAECDGTEKTGATIIDEENDKSNFMPFESSIASQITFGGTSSTDQLAK